MIDRNPKETQDHAKAAINAFYDAISDAESLELRNLPKRLLAKNARPSVKLHKIHTLADKLFCHAVGHAACERGCAHCCYIAVQISVAEAKLIGERIGVEPKDISRVSHRDEQSFSMGTPCSFLKNNECSIYDTRPLACRTNFNFDKDNYWCRYENWDKPGASAPRPSFPELHVAYDMVSKQRPSDSHLADIRDFFPDGDA